MGSTDFTIRQKEEAIAAKESEVAPPPVVTSSTSSKNTYSPQLQHQLETQGAITTPVTSSTGAGGLTQQDVEQIVEPSIPDDTTLTRNAIQIAQQQGFTPQGAVVEGRVVPYGSFTVTLTNGRQVTPSSYNNLLVLLVEDQKFQYRQAGSYHVLQGYTPVRTETGVQYVKEEASSNQVSDQQKIDDFKERGTVNGKTWGEFLRDNPGSQVTIRDGQLIVVTPRDDAIALRDWAEEQYVEGATPQNVVRAGTAAIVGGTFNPMFWLNLMTGDVEGARDVIRSWEYNTAMEFKDTDNAAVSLGKTILTSPGYTNVVYPLMIVSGLSYIGAVGKLSTVGVSKAAEVAIKSAKAFPWAIGGGSSVLIGHEYGMAFATEPKKIVPMTAQLAMQMGLMALGGGAIRGLKGLIQEKVVRYKGTDVTYYQQTGGVTVRNVYDVMGLEVKSPFYKAATGKAGLDFFMREQPVRETVPVGLAQGSRWRPSKVSDDIIVAVQGKKVFVSPRESIVWQPQTGTVEPYIRTGYEVGFLNLKPAVRQPPGKMIEYDSLVHAEDPYVTEVNRTLGMLSSKWQPRTEIPLPVERKPVTIADVVKNGTSPLDVVFKRKEAPVRTTKIGFDADGDLVATKYGVTELANKRWQPLTGTFEQPQRTGKELWTTVYPKPAVRQPPGKLSIYEPSLNIFGFLESGQTLETEGLVKIVSTKKKPITLKDILGTVEASSTGGSPQVQKEGQETILIMENPEVKSLSDVVVESDLVIDMDTVSEVASIGAQRGSQVTLGKQKQKQVSFEEYKPVTIQKQDIGSLSLFKPMYETAKAQSFISEMAQASEQDTRQRRIISDLVVSLSDSLQGQQQVSLSRMDQKRITLSEDVVVTIDTVIDKVVTVKIPEFIERKPPETITPKTPKLLPSDDDTIQEKIKKASGPESYVVMFRKRQYVDGRRVNDRTYHEGSKPLTMFDALSFGMYVCDNTAKASFELEESDRKPQRLGRNIPDWTSKAMEYTQTKPNRWVEDAHHRIDSPGELKAITMKGIVANRGGRKH